MSCLFCKIVAGDLPAHKLYEDERVLVFLDIQPGAPGHALVIPRAHATGFLDLDGATRDAIFSAAQRIAPALIEEVGAEGLNLHQSNGEAAGQVVFHFHLHLLPRRRGDGLCSPWVAGESSAEELSALAERVKARL